MDIFFSGKSAQDKGTLFHLKNLFGHRGVKKQIGDSFNHASTFLKFVTYGYTLLAAMEVLHMESITDEPTDIDTVRNKTEYVMNIARQIVDLIWFEIDVNRIVNAREDGSVYEFCYCKEGISHYYILYFVLYEFREFSLPKLSISSKKKRILQSWEMTYPWWNVPEQTVQGTTGST